MIYTTDDVCPENLMYWKYWDEAKARNPQLRVIAFTIANYKNEQNIQNSERFRAWYEQHKDWVEIGVHGYDHLAPPEQERDDAEKFVIKSLEILRPFLPEKFLYRPPGFQRSINTEPMLERLGFAGIAYETKIRYFKETRVVEGLFNSHCCDRYFNPVTNLRRFL